MGVGADSADTGARGGGGGFPQEMSMLASEERVREIW